MRKAEEAILRGFARRIHLTDDDVQIILRLVNTSERALRDEMQADRQLLLDLWQYATGKAWGELSEDDAACSGDTLASLHARMREFIDRPDGGGR